MALRSLAVPAVLGLRWAGRRGGGVHDEVPAPPRSLSLAAKMAVDELFLTVELVSAGFASLRERHRIESELRDALAFYEAQGWLERPEGFHRTPPPAAGVRQRPSSLGALAYRHLSFESGYAPHPGEPGRARWLSYERNRTAHAWVLRHPGRPRPWVVCIPGYRMGHPAVDLIGFDAARLHRRHGLNVAIPVLPLHGPRRVGRRGGDGLLSGELLDTVHLLAQAAWDVRRLLRWLRASGAPAVALQGLSLGGYTAALVASLEEDLDCVIAGIPAADFVRIVRWHAPALMWRVVERLGYRLEPIERLLRVVSPLAMRPRVPHERRFLFAATADRLAPPDHARDLWRHWDRPRMAWYHGSHLSFRLEREVERLVLDAFEACGLLTAGRARRAS